MTKEKNVLNYVLRLFGFFCVCVLVGVVVLILCFAPATNPRFLSGVLYRGASASDIRDLKKFSAMFGKKTPSVVLLESLERAPGEQDFAQAGVEKPEDVSFKTSDGVTLSGWYFKGTGPDTALVCYNGFGKRLPLFVGYVKMLREAGLNVMLFDYRGKNDESVKATPETACVDAQAAYDYLINERKVNPDNLILIGRDLGSRACLMVASQHKCKALVLENPWGTVKAFVEKVPGAIAMRLVPEFLYGGGVLNNIELVKEGHAPIVVISDEPEMTDAGHFFEAIPGPKSYLYVEEYMPTMLAPDLAADGEGYTKILKTIVSGQPLPAVEKSSVNWQTNYAAALAQCKSSGKPLYVDFGAPWCVYCRKMDEITYVNADVASKINADYVPVKLDTGDADAKRLVQKYPFAGIPTVLIMDGEEKLQKKFSGFFPPGKLMRKLASTETQ